jgi:23S rRNA (guanosine2251-2'-O)-methyltransferase
VDWLVGFHPVREALRARRRRLTRLWLRAGLHHAGLGELRALAAEADVPVEEVDAAALRGRAGDLREQGVGLEAGPLPTPSLEELLTTTPSPRRLVVLDGVEDPQNLGAIVRVADASGAHGVVQAARRAPPLSPAVSRASAGALEHLPVARVPNLTRALRTLRDASHWVIGADPEGEPLFELPDRTFEGDLVFVLGAEGHGIRPGVESWLDHRVAIPMAGRVASLNVATAAAVLLFESVRRDRVRGSSAGS